MSRTFLTAAILLATLALAPKSTSAAVIIQRPLYVGLTNGLVGYWSFDGADMSRKNNMALDRSGQGNNGTITNGATTTIGKLGQALSFDGVNDYVNAGDPASGALDFGTATNFTLSAWVKPSTNGTTILGKRQEGGSPPGYHLYTDSGNIYVTLDEASGGGCTIKTVSTLSLNVWQHITAVVFRRASCDHDNDIIIYINGIRQAGDLVNGANNTNIDISTDEELLLGAHDAGGSPSAFFNGTIDDVRIYNRALSAAEVKRLYKIGGTMVINKGVSTGSLSNGLVGYWSFDGADISRKNNMALDRSGKGNNGTITNGATTTAGKLGQALAFDGTNDYVSVADNAVFDLSTSGSYTWSAWVNPKDLANDAPNELNFAWRQKEGGSSRFELSLNSTDAAAVGPVTNGVSANWVSGGGVTNLTLHSTDNVLAESRWNHVTVTYNGSLAQSSRFQIFVDGVNVTNTGDVDETGTIGAISSDLIEIGGDSDESSQMCKCNVDEMRYYNRALSPAEIKRLYKIGGTMTINKPQDPGLTSLGTGLVGYWPFDGADMTSTVSGGAGTTGAKTPGANAAVAGRGDAATPGFQTTTGTGDLANIDANGLTDTNTGTAVADDDCSPTPHNEGDYHYFTTFGLNVPPDATVNGITVTVSASVDDSTAVEMICVALSPDAGVSTSTAQATTDVGTSVATFTLGGTTDTWGRTWKTSEFSDANFRVYLMPNPPASNNRDYFLDRVTVDVAYTLPNTASPSIALDRSGRGNNGTATNGPKPTIGKLGQALNFDGTNDYVSVADNAVFDLSVSGNYTWSAWVYPKDLANDAPNELNYLWRQKEGGGSRVELSLNSTDSGSFGAVTNGVSMLWATGAGAQSLAFHSKDNVLAQGRWSHIAITYNGSLAQTSRIQIFVDGVNVTDTVDVHENGTISGSISPNLIEIGGDSEDSTQMCKCNVDEMRYYNRVLSVDEIKRLYIMGQPK